MDSRYIMSIDDSKRICEGLSDEEKSNFKYAMFKSFSGSIIVRKADGSDFTTEFDKKHMEFITYAIPKDYKPKKPRVPRSEETEETIIISNEEMLRDKYDFISEDAEMFEFYKYSDSDFINSQICIEMWKLGVELKTISGWAYYSSVPTQLVSKKAVPSIFVRPLLSDDFKSNIVRTQFFSEAYLKEDYPEIADLSWFMLKKQGSEGIKKAIREIVLKQENMSCIKLMFKSGKVVKSMFTYYEDKDFDKISELKKLLRDDIPNFDFHNYVKDNSNRVVVEDANKMLQDFKDYIKTKNNGE